MSLPILCIDFDGVLHSYTSGWKGADKVPDPPVKDAMAFLRETIRYFTVAIYSARSSQPGGIEAMKRAITTWLTGDLDMLWPEAQHMVDTILVWPTTKPSAFLTLDDRAICFTGTFPTVVELMGFQTWQQKERRDG